jgi:nucleoside-diphosphate-sugar epimerase
MKVLVTGASGFVGQALVAEFNARGFETIAVGGPRSKGCDYSIDIGDASAVDAVSREQDVDAVVHSAGIAHRFGGVSDDEFQRVNVTLVENIARLAVTIGAKHFMLFSSTLVYGRRSGTGEITENDQCRPFDAYAQSKLDGENAARNICEAAGINITIFRPAPIMGEGSKGNFARLIRAIDKHRFVWVGKGVNRKSVVYVGDVAKAAAAVLESGGKGTQIFNLAADPVTMKHIVDAIAAKLVRKVPPVHLPVSSVRAAFGISGRLAATLDTWLANDVYSNGKLQKTYGFKPSTSLETAIGREVEYYLKHK